jgi:hypothetical protein
MAASINAGILAADLERIAQLVRELLSIRLDSTAKDAIKRLVEEVSKAYDILVDSYTPFNSLKKNDQVFQNEFMETFGIFKNAYMKSFNNLDVSCRRVDQALSDLIDGRSYLSKFPVLRNKVKNFKDNSDAWYTNDRRIYDIVNGFYKDMYNEMAAIESSFGGEPISDSRMKLNSLISRWDNEFFELKRKLDDFRKSSDQLR